MSYPYIRYSRKFYDRFEVVVNDQVVIPCYNLATARSIIKDYTVNNIEK